jgi:hypothetical protein
MPVEGSSNCGGVSWLGWADVTTGFTAPNEVTVTQYDKDGSATITKTTDLDYRGDNHLQVTAKTETTSNGRERVTEYEYAHEEFCGGSDCVDYTEMGPGENETHQVAQKYQTTVKNGSGTVLRRSWQTWKETTDGYWVPAGKYVWTGP